MAQSDNIYSGTVDIQSLIQDEASRFNALEYPIQRPKGAFVQNPVWWQRFRPKTEQYEAVIDQQFYPFTPYNQVIDTMAGTTDFNIWPGTFNNLIPTNNYNVLTVNNTGTFFIQVDGTTDGKQITGCTLQVTGTPSGAPSVTSGAAPTTVSAILYVIQDGAFFRCWGTGGVVGVPVEVSRVAAASPAPFELNYTSLFTWSLRST